MSRGTFHGQILFTIVAILVSSWVSGATLYGVYSPNGPGQLLTIDAATGAPTVIGPVSSTTDGIAFAPNGVLYAADNSSRQLVTLNSATGSVASVIGFYGNSDPVEGLAVRPSDEVLFGIDNDEPSHLVTLDTTTGTVTSVGPFGIGVTDGMAGLAFNLDGSVLYAIGFHDGCLYTVNQSTGAATSVGCGASWVTGGPLGMARDPVSGTLYVAEYWDTGTAVLAIVSVVDGSRTTVGPITGFDQIEGLSFNEEVPVELMKFSVE